MKNARDIERESDIKTMNLESIDRPLTTGINGIFSRRGEPPLKPESVHQRRNRKNKQNQRKKQTFFLCRKKAASLLLGSVYYIRYSMARGEWEGVRSPVPAVSFFLSYFLTFIHPEGQDLGWGSPAPVAAERLPTKNPSNDAIATATITLFCLFVLFWSLHHMFYYLGPLSIANPFSRFVRM